jgi:hypothetical protein
LHHKIKNLAFVIDGAPEIHPTPVDRTDHLIQMPARDGAGRWRFRFLAICGPNLIVQQRIV